MKEISTNPTKGSERSIDAASADSPSFADSIDPAAWRTARSPKARNQRKRNARRRALEALSLSLERAVHNATGTKLRRRFYAARQDSRGTAAQAWADYARRAEPEFRAGESMRRVEAVIEAEIALSERPAKEAYEARGYTYIEGITP